jgi:hypothetical protein
MSRRVISDTASRLKRLRLFVDLDHVRTEPQLRAALIQSPAFEKLSVSVKSQLRRAGILFLQFRGSRK